MKKIITFMASAILTAACASSNGALLDNQSFTISDLNGTELVSITEEPASISFSEGRCNAYVGGNRITATYKEGKDGELSLEYGASTKMMVPEECREDEFIAAFNSVASFKLDGNTVVFFDKDGVELFRASK